MADQNKSILKEALTSYEEIVEAANAKAADKLSKEFPDKFKEYLKEELNKNNSEKESTKDVDEKKESDEADENIEKNKEDKMKTENKKETQQEVKKNKTKETLKKVEENLSEGDTKKSKKSVNESYDDFDPEAEHYRDEEGDEIDLLTKERGVDVPKEDEKYLERGKDDEFSSEYDDDDFTFEELENEISKMEEIEENQVNEEELEEKDDSVAHGDSVSYIDKGKGGVAFHQLAKVKNMLDEILDNVGDEKTQVTEIEGEEPSPEHNDDVLTDDDLERILNDESEIDEHHGITHAARKKVTSKLPRKGQGLPKSHEPQLRSAMQEAENKVKDLIDSNKKTTKRLNENRKKLKVLGELVEGYKTALGKYRDQLKSMSVFNTNLAHVNNILVNEELALTQKDKVKVINEFKQLNSIAESEEKYKKILSEMKNRGKKPLKENLDEKLSKSSSVQNSSKKALDEVVEKTAYENNEHINKIKRMNEFLDKRSGKKVLG